MAISARKIAVFNIRKASPQAHHVLYLKPTFNPILTASLTSVSSNYKDGTKNWNEDLTLEGDHGDRSNKQGRDTVDTARDTAGAVVEMAKESTVKAMDTAVELGEKTKQTKDNAWDAAKETSKNVKKAVLDDSNLNSSYENDPSHLDKHVEDLRRCANGYDLKSCIQSLWFH